MSSKVITPATEPDAAGYLKKKGGKIKKYRKRYFELYGHELFYFKVKGAKKSTGSITLTQSCRAEIDETRKASFKIKGSGLSRVFELSADTDEERDMWIRLINKAAQGGDDVATLMNENPEDSIIFNQDDNSKEVGLDSFDYLKVIGRGSFGKVMLVRKKDNQELYAMKILRKDMIIKENMVSHTKAEKDILEQMDHPFIVSLRYAFQTTDKLYLVLDFLAGGELFFHLKEENKFSVERARFYAAEIVCALGHLHKHDIIYRDLKPENVVLDKEGHVVLTDFGLAKTCITNAKPTKTFCGTPEYLAPEILNAKGHAKAVDWWSLGVLLYEMICGLPPFYSENVHEMYELIVKAPLRFPKDVPPDAQQLLRGLLEREEFKRLGAGPKDMEDIKCHPFFKSIDWDKLMKRELTPPFIPKLDDPTKYFDREFTDERIQNTICESIEDSEDNFDDFYFNRDHDRRKKAYEEFQKQLE